MSKVRVLAVSPGKTGVGKYRILDPFMYIGNNHDDEVHVVISYDVEDKDEFFLDFDVVYFHTKIHKGPYENTVKRIKWLKEKGIKTIVDLDDYWILEKSNPLYTRLMENNIPIHKVEIYKLADYITVTTPILAKTVKEKTGNKNVFVLPNAIDPNEPQLKIEPTESERVRFGWVGGSTHLRDIELLSDGIKRIQTEYKDDSQFVLCGYDLKGTVRYKNPITNEIVTRDIKPIETIWYQYENIFTDYFKNISLEYNEFLHKFVNETNSLQNNEVYVRRWTESINTYIKNYNHFDVSLIPLFPSEFNKHKSQLKIIESGFMKKPAIVSETEPYSLDLISAYEEGKFIEKGNALLVNPKRNHKNWYKYMKLLIDNPNFRTDLSEKLYETVNEKFSLKYVTKLRIELLKQI
jgi:glycosyltransferase involved in cell wall biosynthesis